MLNDYNLNLLLKFGMVRAELKRLLQFENLKEIPNVLFFSKES
jgi:hypothetical protein